MKKIFIISLLIVFTSTLFSQDKLFTIDDVVLNSYTSLAPSNLQQLSWLPGTNTYSYISKEKDEDAIVLSNPLIDTDRTVVTLSKFNEALSSKMIDNVKRFPKYKWIDKSTFTFWNNNSLYSYSLSQQAISLIANLPENFANKEISPNKKMVAFTVDNNLYINSGNENNIQITNESNKDIVCGQSVHRNEFGIDGGIFWSPKSNFIAYYRMDQTMVTDYPLVKMGTTPATVEWTKYPMAGQTSHQVTIGIYNVKTRKEVWLDTGEPLDQYLTCVTWGPNEEFIYVALLNRDQNHMQLVKYDAESGAKIKILFEENDKEYFEPENPLLFLPGNDNQFIWNSERDGFNHLYLYNTDGDLIKQLTHGNWVVLKTHSFDKEGENLFITTTKESPLYRDLYSVNIKTGNLERVTMGSATHKVTPNDDGDYFIDSYTSTETPRTINIIDAKGEIIKKLHKSENPIAEYKLGKREIFTIKANDGTELYSQLIYPADFDPSKKYPVIVYVYGGPHAQLVTNSWYYGRYDFWFQHMAQKGYAVFTVDNRGSANRGLEFEQAVFRHLGTVEIADQLAGVEYLKSLPWIDMDRLGVFGWSYGGFMTTSLMLRTNDTFKVGVAGGAVIDWKFYEVMYGERYMDTPETNPDGYKEASLLNYVENLNGKLLLVHGTMDPTVVMQNTLEFCAKAQRLNKPLDYFPYVGHEHGVRGKDALHLYNKITNYFLDNL